MRLLVTEYSARTYGMGLRGSVNPVSKKSLVSFEYYPYSLIRFIG